MSTNEKKMTRTKEGIGYEDCPEVARIEKKKNDRKPDEILYKY